MVHLSPRVRRFLSVVAAACLLSTGMLVPGMHTCGAPSSPCSAWTSGGGAGARHSCAARPGTTQDRFSRLVGQMFPCRRSPGTDERQTPVRSDGAPRTDDRSCPACVYLAQLNADGFQIVVAPTHFATLDSTPLPATAETPSRVCLGPAAPRAPPVAL